MDVTPATQELGRLVARILGPALDEVAMMLALPLSEWRLRNTVRALKRARDFLEAEGVRLEELSPKAREILPLLEAASYEDDETLQRLWAGLLAASLRPGATDLSVGYTAILRQLAPVQAQTLLAIRDFERRTEDGGVAGPDVERLAALTEAPIGPILVHLEALGLVAGESGGFDSGPRFIIATEGTASGVWLSPLGRALLNACDPRHREEGSDPPRAGP
jgi:hypothetical protein